MWSTVAWTFQWTGLLVVVGGALTGAAATVLVALVLWDLDLRRAAKSRH